ncbi:MAG: RNA methyltransferase, partial [Epsilonproteobacteria bacterium]|nr:RNA methyltransferase [Campylobacterota bacterium]
KKSQRNFKINFERLKKILIASSQQCGRENIMEIEVVDSLYKFKESYPDSYMLNFSDRIIQKELFSIKEVVVGPEGGFDKEEVNLYKDKIVGFDTPYILKSQTAVVAISSKILL